MNRVVEILGTIERGGATLRFGGESGFSVRVGLFSDSLGDLVRTTRSLSNGWSKGTVSIEDVPERWLCRLTRTNEDLRVELLEFAGSSNAKTSEQVADFVCGWREFAHDLVITMERQRALLGEGYAEAWPHPYPTEPIEELQKYLGLTH